MESELVCPRGICIRSAQKAWSSPLALPAYRISAIPISDIGELSLHMLGLGRPRLRARPSLLELITKKNIDELSANFLLVKKASVQAINQLPPLPASPSKPPQELHLPSPSSPKAQIHLKMAPVSFRCLAGAPERSIELTCVFAIRNRRERPRKPGRTNMVRNYFASRASGCIRYNC
jgi:hypothetical protein